MPEVPMNLLERVTAYQPSRPVAVNCPEIGTVHVRHPTVAEVEEMTDRRGASDRIGNRELFLRFASDANGDPSFDPADKQHRALVDKLPARAIKPVADRAVQLMGNAPEGDEDDERGNG